MHYITNEYCFVKNDLFIILYRLLRTYSSITCRINKIIQITIALIYMYMHSNRLNNNDFSYFILWFRFMVFNATFNNISIISWRSVLFVKETGENQRPVASHWQILSHIVVSSTKMVVVIGTDCIGSYKSNYHTITTATAPFHIMKEKKIKDDHQTAIFSYISKKNYATVKIYIFFLKSLV